MGREEGHRIPRAVVLPPMTRTLGIQLIGYALVLGGLSWLAHELAPEVGRTALLTGLVGGAVCAGWGVWALARRGGRAGPILSLIPIGYLLLSQAVMVWGSLDGSRARLGAALVLTVLFGLSVGMLMWLAYAGLSPAPAGRKESAGNPTSASEPRHK